MPSHQKFWLEAIMRNLDQQNYGVCKQYAELMMEELKKEENWHSSSQTIETSSVPQSTTGPAIRPCPSCGASLGVTHGPSGWSREQGEPCYLWACSKCGTEVLIPKKIFDRLTINGSSGNEASEPI